MDDTTIELELREGIQFQDGTSFGSENFHRAFVEVQRWKAPHPPGTYLNFDPDTDLEVVDGHTVRMRFPQPDGLAWASSVTFIFPAIVSGTSWASATRRSAAGRAIGE